MDERKFYSEPWDDSVYGTGPTQPPKDRGGLIAILLVLLIFLCGIIAALGIMNIKLFQKLKTVPVKQDDLAISFSVRETEPTVVVTEPTEAAVMPVMESNPTMALQQVPGAVANIPQEGGLSLQDIYQKNIPSVVSIICRLPGGNSTGTGVVLTSDGYVVTNSHVVEDALSISVQLTDQRVFSAMLIGADEISDLAVLYIDTMDLTPAEFGDSESLQVGDIVTAIGDPLGVEFRGTYTDGIVSAINRNVDMDGRTMTLIQTNAALNSGNSGGPLINCFGQVIGINTMKIGAFTDKAGVEGLGFAIPSATVKAIVDQLLLQGYVSGRPAVGIEGESLSNFYQYYYHLPAGLYITYVDPGSDAYRVGIEEGDILLSLGEYRITTMEELKSAVFQHDVGDAVEAVIYRGGQQYRVELTLSEDKG